MSETIVCPVCRTPAKNTSIDESRWMHVLTGPELDEDIDEIKNARQMYSCPCGQAVWLNVFVEDSGYHASWFVRTSR
jgi:hypothetical protein